MSKRHGSAGSKTYEEAYKEGAAARSNNVRYSQCPYNGSALTKLEGWRDGWNAADLHIVSTMMQVRNQ